jgi:hypothetical protein
VIGYIEPIWLEAIHGGALFYPAAGNDTRPFVELFSTSLRQYHFNDLFYSVSSDQRSPVPLDWRRVRCKAVPGSEARNHPYEMKNIGSVSYRSVEPTKLVEEFEGQRGTIEVTRRRGFGQYALAEFEPRSISVFVHRSDSASEGGSNMWFLANRSARHPPLARLWDSLASRLADRALIISDGSLTTFEFLEQSRSLEARSLYSNGITYNKHGFKWRCVGYMHDRPRSAIWGLSRSCSG